MKLSQISLSSHPAHSLKFMYIIAARYALIIHWRMIGQPIIGAEELSYNQPVIYY
jgi:hypothetical protein